MADQEPPIEQLERLRRLAYSRDGTADDRRRLAELEAELTAQSDAEPATVTSQEKQVEPLEVTISREVAETAPLRPRRSTDDLSHFAEAMVREREVERDVPPPVDPVIRRKRRRRRAIIGGIVGLVVAALLGGYITFALTAPIGSATIDATAPTVTPPAATLISMSPEGESAISVSGADDYLGASASGIWMSGGGDDPLPIASISKLITTLVVLDAKPLGAGENGPTITFDKADHALYDKYYVLDATIAAMPTGSSMSEHDALEMMLVISASNYAEAVSTWAFGSQSSFLRATKTWLAANGLDHTTMVEPTGIDARNTSTPSDLIALAKIAMANPVVAEIVKMQTLEVPNVPPQLNTNDLLGVDGISGIKTGTLDPSGSNLLFSATMDVGTGTPLNVVGVVLGGFSHESVDLDVKALLASITAGFHNVNLGNSGDEIGTYATPWGESAKIVLGKSSIVLTWSDTPITTTFTVEPLTTGARGDTVGEITWVAGATTVTAPLILDADIDPPTAWWRLTHPFDLGG
ncbi:MAG: D-alanyl-D-alanine carboxypeptidase [Pseudolysinimonas sp.]|uniref:D-alanyl-D-alanine carboxypeptidase family protein n=1 Tax=Pseudolysinimonas sp. TaxID=2680009 RepID=UPI003267ADAF